ncbi:MAG: tetratricopeptide repeat protein [Fimbriimonas sp.]
MPPWKVQLLGGMRLCREGVVVSRFRTRATDAVFAYLAVHLGQEVRRDKLIELVWPHVDIDAGRQSLRTSLTFLRQTLGSECLDATRNGVRLVESCFEIDVDEFRKTHNLDLYQGKLLEGFAFEWAAPLAAKLEEEYRRASTHPQTASPADPEVRAAPHILSSFIGREHELEQVKRLLATNRLVTITGLGGSGKSRLAAELWRRTQPAWYVGLSDVNDPSDVPEAIRQALRLPLTPERSILEQIAREVGSGLLILDNFEHLVVAAHVVTDLLAHSQSMRIVATSQVPLGLSGEIEFLLGPLSLHPTSSGPSEAVALFEERAKSALPSFAITPKNAQLVVELCQRLDGFPLALEIAAAKSRIFSPTEMLAQLGDRFDFLRKTRKGLAKRQDSLRDALDWSFDRLTDENQTFLTELSIFRGGFTLDAAASICSGDRPSVQLESLLVHSWIQRVPDSEPTRFRLLESIREYGSEFLTSKQQSALASKHAAYFLELCRACGRAAFTADESRYHILIEADSQNVDAAWYWLSEHDPESGLSLVESADWYWILKGQGHVMEARIKDALAKVDKTPRPLLVRAHHVCGNYILFQRRFAESIPWFQRGYEMATELGDILAQGLNRVQLAQALAEQGDLDEALEHGQGALDHLIANGTSNWIGAGYAMLALIANRMGDAETGLQMAIQADVYYSDANYAWGRGAALNEMAMACHLAGRYEESLAYQRESIAIKRECRAPWSIAVSLSDKAATQLALGDYDGAMASVQEAFATLRSIGGVTRQPELFGTAALLLINRKEEALAAAAFGTMLSLTKGRALTIGERTCAEKLRELTGSRSMSTEALVDRILVI